MGDQLTRKKSSRRIVRGEVRLQLYLVIVN